MALTEGEMTLISDYIEAAMKQARYEILKDDGTYHGEIPGFDGVWSNAGSLEKCRKELEEVLEEWIVLGLRKDLPLPEIDGFSLAITRT